MRVSPRVLADRTYYHLIGRGNNRLAIFDVPGGFDAFRGLLARALKRYRWALHHYCLMSNHFHLMAYVEKGNELPKMMQFILRQYSRFYRLKRDYTGYLWEGRYRSLVIAKDSHYLECGRYIERNPVRAGICARPEDYAWSSYRHYAYGIRDPLIEDDWHFVEMSVDESLRRERYRDFVGSANPYEAAVDAALGMQPSVKRAKIAA